MRKLFFWFRFFRKHSRYAMYEREQYEMFGVFVVRSKCKCGWVSADHGQTPTGEDAATQEFIDHLQAEVDKQNVLK